jgi:hypothetical protein
VSNDDDRRLVSALLAALQLGPVQIEHQRMDGLASAYRPDEGLVWLNPDAAVDEQAAELVRALGRVHRAPLRLVTGGAA